MTTGWSGHMESTVSIFDINSKYAAGALILAVVFATVLLAAPAGHAQSFQVLYNFAQNRGLPFGLAADRAGNFYGTQYYGLFGSIFKFSRAGSGWVISDLYKFQGAPDGSSPAGVTVAADGSLYGVTGTGGTGPCDRETYNGCGTVFRLQPPAVPCRATRCYWTETVLYSFQGSPDLQYPAAEVTFDQAGNMYGTAYAGGTSGFGGLFELTRSQGGWTYKILYSFSGPPPDGANPEGSVTIDQAGNLYGPTLAGGTGTLGGCEGHGCGTVYQLTPSGSGWNETVLHNFGISGGSDGEAPIAGLLLDRAGNLYGTTEGGGSNDGSTVFEFSPSNGAFAFSVLNTLPGSFSLSKLVMDQAGSLYGSTEEGGLYGYGMVFKLTPGSNGWTFTSLHDFDFNDGFGPSGDMVLDANGNLYGTAVEGGLNNEGVIWEITP